jgi:hypothetical protein
MILILSLVGGGYYGYVQYPDEINRFLGDTTDKVKIFARKYGIDLGAPRAPRIAGGGRQGTQRWAPRMPGAYLRSRESALERRRREVAAKAAIERKKAEEEKRLEEKAKAERRKKIEKSRPEKIKDLGDILKHGKKAEAPDGWVTLGTGKPKSRVERSIGKLDKLKSKAAIKKGKADASFKTSAKKHEGPAPESSSRKKTDAELFNKLGRLRGVKASDDALESMRKLASSRKLSKDQIFRHLDTIAKDEGVKARHMDKIVGHVLDEGKASRKSVEDALASLAKKGSMAKKDIREILSKVRK